MTHYLDIHLRPDPEIPTHHLMAALYAKLHRGLATGQVGTIGVSFPGYKAAPATLGGTLRLVGPQLDLSRLMEHDWLKGMRDHSEVMPRLPFRQTRCNAAFAAYKQRAARNAYGGDRCGATA